jgi:hypothetical protein
MIFVFGGVLMAIIPNNVISIDEIKNILLPLVFGEFDFIFFINKIIRHKIDVVINIIL